MARKITLHGQFRKSVAEVFEDFIISQAARGLSDITLSTYRSHIRSISNPMMSEAFCLFYILLFFCRISLILSVFLLTME